MILEKTQRLLLWTGWAGSNWNISPLVCGWPINLLFQELELVSQRRVWVPGSIQFKLSVNVEAEACVIPKLPCVTHPNFLKSHKSSTNLSYSGRITEKCPQRGRPVGQLRGADGRQHVVWQPRGSRRLYFQQTEDENWTKRIPFLGLGNLCIGNSQPWCLDTKVYLFYLGDMCQVVIYK